ncbi:ferredoxin [Micromonospora sp. NBC_01796]|uniref:ferredoxin n=1 Tax=Micromonospora sp. NBC_01796 TaxID=2975987 RepID=UPI002DDB1FCE|nr:ferredoxin [Micromonospora sp. NBC_01796]WSA87502.1 ferredoxin [Micromonospora sp. NBC_01796]
MATTRWRVSVNPNACVSSGNCVSIARGRFELTDDGARPRAELLDPDDDVVEAAETCPMEAIRIIDVTDNSVVAP